AVDTLGHEPRLPAPDRRFAFAGLPLDRHRADPGGTQQYDPSPPGMLAGYCPTRLRLPAAPGRPAPAGPRSLFSSGQTRMSASRPESFVSVAPLAIRRRPCSATTVGCSSAAAAGATLHCFGWTSAREGEVPFARSCEQCGGL